MERSKVKAFLNIYIWAQYILRLKKNVLINMTKVQAVETNYYLLLKEHAFRVCLFELKNKYFYDVIFFFMS